MLARSAQGLYWMGRNLERAAHICRLLQMQVPALIDRPLEEIHAGWNLIYNSLKCLPPGGILNTPGEDFTLADAFTLAGDLTFEESNPNSIRLCLGGGRENARQMRHCITDVMWLNLNHEFLDFKSTDMTQVWRSAPEEFYVRTEQHLNEVFSLADLSMYRDAAWHFIQLGRSIECVQSGTALLTGAIATSRQVPDSVNRQIRIALRVFKASESYNRIHGHVINDSIALDMLVADRLLPGSLANHSAAVEDHILGIGPGHSEQCGLVRRSAERLKEHIIPGWQKAAAKDGILAEIELESRILNDRINLCHFSYDAD